MAITLYGIKNCDTVKKARAWLDGQGVAYRFHDHKLDGVSEKKLRAWCKSFGWEIVLNRAGTTFRALPEADKLELDAEKAVALMLRQSSLIKRPILEGAGKPQIGFKPEIYAKVFEG